MKTRTYYRAVFVSDAHLGFRGVKSKALSKFLKSIECDTLVLVGDIIDLWAMRKGIWWDSDTLSVIRRILKMNKQGTRIIYVTGNHDDPLRSFVPLEFENVLLDDEYVHTTRTGKQFIVLHGDKFDLVIHYMRWVAVLGSVIYDWLVAANSVLHTVRMKLGFRKYWSLAGYMKKKAKRAVSFIQDFEDTTLAYARSKGAAGVICGHIHTPKMYEKDGLIYANCGDWIESLSAVVETEDGSLELVHWHAMD